MSRPVIRVENVSKLYHLGELGTGQLSTDFSRWWAKTFKGHDPYAKIDAKNETSSKEYWALKDITFDVNQGDVLGIIGKNGAGKSTLLKILSRITTPTSGHIKVKGRIASLLEVGTGFHPDLTGRENVYLNGSFLGMRKKEIDAKFDEIVDFSGIEKFIDTPVKRYSSGMYVRLAFAVAAHLEPEILIVDEVLAVGDAEFQKKCLGKMQDVSKNGGRTVLFVSHDMNAIFRLCSKGIVLKNGNLAFLGRTEDAVENYLKKDESDVSERKTYKHFDCFELVGSQFGGERNKFQTSEELTLKVSIKLKEKNARIGAAFKNSLGLKIFTSVSEGHIDSKNIQLKIPSNTFLTGRYSIDLAYFILNGEVFEYIEDDLIFEMFDLNTPLSGYTTSEVGLVNVQTQWIQ